MRILIVSICLTFCSLPVKAQTQLSDDQIQSIITFAHDRTMGLDHFKYYTGLIMRTHPFNEPLYKVELFKASPNLLNKQLIRFDGVRYYISKESYEKQDCLLYGCEVEEVSYANLVGKASTVIEEGFEGNLIEVNGQIEDSALVRVLRIANSPVKSIIEGNLESQLGRLKDIEIDQLLIDRQIGQYGGSPISIRVNKTREGSRLYNVSFSGGGYNSGINFNVLIHFSGTNGQDIRLEITRAPVP